MTYSKNENSFIQYPLPLDVRMIVDFEKIDDCKWCLILNDRFFYNPLGLTLDLTPSFRLTYKVQVIEDNKLILIVYSDASLLPNAIMGSLIYLPSSFPSTKSFQSFIDRRKHGCYIDAMKEILKTYNITDYIITRF